MTDTESDDETEDETLYASSHESDDDYFLEECVLVDIESLVTVKSIEEEFNHPLLSFRTLSIETF